MPDYNVGGFLVAKSLKDESETLLGWDPGLSLPTVEIPGYVIERHLCRKYFVGSCPEEMGIEDLVANKNQANNLDLAFSMLNLISPLLPDSNVWAFDNNSRSWKIVSKPTKEDEKSLAQHRSIRDSWKDHRKVKFNEKAWMVLTFLSAVLIGFGFADLKDTKAELIALGMINIALGTSAYIVNSNLLNE